MYLTLISWYSDMQSRLRNSSVRFKQMNWCQLSISTRKNTNLSKLRIKAKMLLISETYSFFTVKQDHLFSQLIQGQSKLCGAMVLKLSSRSNWLSKSKPSLWDRESTSSTPTSMKSLKIHKLEVSQLLSTREADQTSISHRCLTSLVHSVRMRR